MTDYGSNAFVKGASLMEKVFLLSLAQVVKRKGVVEVELDEVSPRAPTRTCFTRTWGSSSVRIGEPGLGVMLRPLLS